VFAAEDVVEDVHYRARGFPVALDDDDLGRPVVYPGAPFLMERSPWRLRRRAPRLGEHNGMILDR
jgi:benzylsuccinate CoA-transferase BbsE subunit